MDKYKILDQIGSGAFSTVLKAVNNKTNEIVAVKKMKSKFSSWDECINLREIKSLRKLSHDVIIKLKEVIQVTDELYLIFEYAPKNLLQYYSSYKHKSVNIPEPLIKSIMYQITLGLSFMHKHGFFHRDLKPENLLLDKKSVKIIDFGLAREIR